MWKRGARVKAVWRLLEGQCPNLVLPLLQGALRSPVAQPA